MTKIFLVNVKVHVVQAQGGLLARPVEAPMIYDRLVAQENSASDCGKNNVRVTRAEPSVLENGPRMREHKSKQSTERYTRTSGHRAMHQSGWSFSGKWNH